MLNISRFGRVKSIYISQNLYYTFYCIYKNLKLNTETIFSQGDEKTVEISIENFTDVMYK